MKFDFPLSPVSSFSLSCCDAATQCSTCIILPSSSCNDHQFLQCFPFDKRQTASARNSEIEWLHIRKPATKADESPECSLAENLFQDAQRR